MPLNFKVLFDSLLTRTDCYLRKKQIFFPNSLLTIYSTASASQFLFRLKTHYFSHILHIFLWFKLSFPNKLNSVGTGHNFNGITQHLIFLWLCATLHPPTSPTSKTIVKEIYRFFSYTKSIKLFSACIFYMHRLLRSPYHHTPHYRFWSINRVNLLQQLYDFLIINWLSSVSWMFVGKGL